MPLLTQAKKAFEHSFGYALAVAAFFWRRMLPNTTFIAITGSNGKTTAAALCASILAGQAPTIRSAHRNNLNGISHTLLRARPRHRFVVVEVGISRPSQMRKYAWLLRPDIAVVTGVALEHTARFKEIRSGAGEKEKLLLGLPKHGVAVLNADNPWTAEMRPPEGRSSIWFGLAAGSDVSAESVEARWPGRLRFRAKIGEESVAIETQFVGMHWTQSTLAALGGALACGVPLAATVAPVRRLAPRNARLEPVSAPSGATFLRDDHNGSMPTTEVAFATMEGARAERKFVVTGDYAGLPDEEKVRRQRLGRMAAEIFDVAVFVGELASVSAEAARQAGMSGEAVKAFLWPEDAALFLREELRSGDLVLLRGLVAEHLTRILYRQFGEVGCWASDCGRRTQCDSCPELRVAPQEPLPVQISRGWQGA